MTEEEIRGEVERIKTNKLEFLLRRSVETVKYAVEKLSLSPLPPESPVVKPSEPMITLKESKPNIQLTTEEEKEAREVLQRHFEDD